MTKVMLATVAAWALVVGGSAAWATVSYSPRHLKPAPAVWICFDAGSVRVAEADESSQPGQDCVRAR